MRLTEPTSSAGTAGPDRKGGPCTGLRNTGAWPMPRGTARTGVDGVPGIGTSAGRGEPAAPAIRENTPPAPERSASGSTAPSPGG